MMTFEEDKPQNGGVTFSSDKTAKPQVPDQELASLVVGEHFDFWTQEFANSQEELIKKVEIGDTTELDMAMLKQADRAVNTLLYQSEGKIDSPEDLLKLNEQAKQARIINKQKWQIQRAEFDVTDKYIEKALQDPEDREIVGEIIKDFHKDFKVQQAINEARNTANEYLDKESFVNLLQDLLQSAVFAPSDFVNLRDTVDDIFPEENMWGHALSTGALDAMDNRYQTLSADEKISLIQAIVDKSLNRDSFLGVQENVLNNSWILDTILNTLEEHRTPDGGILGIENESDIGLTMYEALDTYSAINFGSLANGLWKALSRKAFGSAKPFTQGVHVTDWYQARLDKAIQAEGRLLEGDVIRAEPQEPMLLSRSGTGSLFDTTKQSSPEKIGKAMDTITSEQFPAFLNKMGITEQQWWERTMPQFSGSIDPTALPPSFYSPALREFMESIQDNSNLTLIGYEFERDLAMAKFRNEFINTVGGYGFISRSYLKPPVQGDSQSLGTAVLRFGGSPDHGFENPRQAIALANILKSRGESAKIIPTDDGYFVETQRTHVISEKDTGKWNAVDGSPLTIKHSDLRKGLHSWSKSVTGVPESVHPQRLMSFAIDSGAEQEKRLLDVLKPYSDLAKSVKNKHQFKLVQEAIKESTALNKPLSERELRELYPDISDKAIDAYQAHKDFHDGIRFNRSEQVRRNMAQRGMKTMQVGDEGFYGKVEVNQPRYEGSATSHKGRPVTDSEDGKLYGSHILNKATGEVTTLNKEFLDNLYATGGRVIKMSEPYSTPHGQFTHVYVDSLSQLRVAELPIVPYFGKDYYGGHVGYKDVFFKLVWDNAPNKLNGVDITAPKAIGGVATKAEADEFIEFAKKEWPDRQIVVEKSRELKKALGESIGTANMNTYLKKKGDEGLLGAVDETTGAPAPAPTIPQSEIMKQDLHSVAYDKLTQAIRFNEARFMHQFAHFMKDDHSSYFPPDIRNTNVWNDAAINKAGIDGVRLKDSANTLHFNIMASREELLDSYQRKFRNRMANMGRTLGANQNAVAQSVSKALINTPQMKAGQMWRGVTSSASISLAFMFQVPQNLISVSAMATTQGVDGIAAVADIGWIIPALRNQGKSASEADASMFSLGQKMGITQKEATDFINHMRSSGVLGNAGAVDNMLRYVSDLVNVDKTFADQMAGWVKSPISMAVQKGSDAVAKSIDWGMMMYYSVAYRKIRKQYEDAGKSIGSTDFWEQVRHQARTFGQNQNRSDMLSYELSASKLVFALQFFQHLHKVSFEGAGTIAKATTGALPDPLKYKGKTVYSKDPKEAWRAMALYTLMFGAGGYGGTGVSLLHDYLPEEVVNPKDELGKARLAALQGGFIDLMVQGTAYAIALGFGEGVTGESPLAVSAKVSPGGAVDQIKNWAIAGAMMIRDLELPIDVLDAFGGAGWGTMTGMGGLFYNTLPNIMSNDELDNWDKSLESLKEISYLGKSFSDAHMAWLMATRGKQVTKRTGNLVGEADLHGAIGKVFGIDTGAVTAKQADFAMYQWDKNYWEGLSKKIIANIRKDANENVLGKPFDQKTYQAWLDRSSAQINSMLANSTPEKYRERVKSLMMSHYLDMIATDDGLAKLIREATYTDKTMLETLDEYIRNPETSEENKQQVIKLRDKLRMLAEREEDKE